jgi:hypothetical protein
MLTALVLIHLHSKPVPRPEIFTFDHTYPPHDRRLVDPPRVAILYASLQSSNFRELHSHLLRLSSGPMPRVQYIFRPIPPKGPAREKTYLSGYGVSLDLKKMDYLALDDRLSNRKCMLRCQCSFLSSHYTHKIPIQKMYQGYVLMMKTPSRMPSSRSWNGILSTLLWVLVSL